jgi:hypothetical protein
MVPGYSWVGRISPAIYERIEPVAQKKKNPSKGRSIVPRAEVTPPPHPAKTVLPVYPTPIDTPDGSPMEEVQERVTRSSLILKIPGFGRLKIDSAGFFRRRK